MLGYHVMKNQLNRLSVSALLLVAVGGVTAALPLAGCENKSAPPAASPADASSGAAATTPAPSSAPAPKAGGGW